MKVLRPILLAMLFVAAAAVAALCTPQPLFAHHLTHGPFDLWSDRSIDAIGARRVLDDAQARISRSDFYSPDQRFRVFICNDNWKLALYSERLSGGMGGVADSLLTRNIYLRQADLTRNRLIPARGWKATMADRPLSYYVAHEATHVMESRALGRLMVLTYPAWKREGYADYVGKAGQFDVARSLADLAASAREMDPKASGLYRRYHLAVAFKLDHRGLTAREMFAETASETEVMAQLKADPTFGR